MDYCDSCGQSKDDRHSLNEGPRSIALRSFLIYYYAHRLDLQLKLIYSVSAG